MRDQYNPDELLDADSLLSWLRKHGENSVEEIFNIRLGNFQFIYTGSNSSCYETDHLEFKIVANVKYKESPKELRTDLGLDPM